MRRLALALWLILLFYWQSSTQPGWGSSACDALHAVGQQLYIALQQSEREEREEGAREGEGERGSQRHASITRTLNKRCTHTQCT